MNVTRSAIELFRMHELYITYQSVYLMYLYLKSF